MDLVKSLDIWIQHFKNTFLINKNIKYDGRSIAGFKNGNKTKQAYDLIMSSVNDIQEMKSDNIDDIFFSLLIKI